MPRTMTQSPPRPDELDHTIRSEVLEEFAKHLIGRWFAKCQEASATGDSFKHEDALMNFWFGLHALDGVAAACPEAVHFSLAMSNRIVGVAKMIEAELGVRPMENPAWKP